VTPGARRLTRILFLVLGALLLGWVVHHAGATKILETARAGLVYLPFLVVCNGAFYVFESMGQRALLGSARELVPRAVFGRATLAAYVASVLLPAGRAGAEAVRVAAYSKYVGGTRALAASAAFQVPALWGTAVLIGLSGAVSAVTLGVDAPLTWIFALHATASAVLGFLLFLVLRRGTLGGHLGRLIPRFAERAASFDQAAALPTELYVGAFAWAVAARATELALFAIVLAAVGLPASPTHSTLAAGIQVVGATAGEAIPGQLGAVEGSFSLFAGALGLPPHSSTAVTIPLLVRVSQYGLAALVLAVLGAWRHSTKELTDGSSATPP
jgi:hypothetical protein